MGEIFNALEVLNRTMKLGLSGLDLMRAEAGFKSALVTHGNPDPNLPRDPVALAEGYELKATFRPRADGAIPLAKLATLARKEVSRPQVRVDAKAFREIDRAIAATAKAPAKAAAKKAPAARAAAPKAAAKAPAKKAPAKAKKAQKG
ncbi:MAG TPA: hypothetical protein VFJ85_03780 [Acidimicrobiales bacterium]|nr:hypothetical protein [Acidimicrobiales bacterium]